MRRYTKIYLFYTSAHFNYFPSVFILHYQNMYFDDLFWCTVDFYILIFWVYCVSVNCSLMFSLVTSTSFVYTLARKQDKIVISNNVSFSWSRLIKVPKVNYIRKSLSPCLITEILLLTFYIIQIVNSKQLIT